MRRQSAVYVGDIGDITVAAPLTPIPLDIDIDALTNRELFKLLLDHGVDVRLILGVDYCYQHVDMIYLGGLPMPEGYSLFENTRYCRNCWAWWRDKHL